MHPGLALRFACISEQPASQGRAPRREATDPALSCSNSKKPSPGPGGNGDGSSLQYSVPDKDGPMVLLIR